MSTATATHRTVVKATSGWAPLEFRLLWSYRELAWTLATREVLVRYKQSFLGAGWAILQPIATMVIFAVLFSALLGKENLPTVPGVPYAISTYCALLPWQLFAQGTSRAATSIIGNAGLVSKIYFPRLIMPLAPVLAALIDFCFAFVVLLGMMVWYWIIPGPEVLFLPIFLLFAIITALAVGLWLASLTTLFRDFQHVVGFLVQILMYVSPILYSAESVLKNKPGWVQIAYGLNPMAGVAEGFRWALLGTAAPDPRIMLTSVIATVVLLVGGLYFFRRVERKFADVV